MDKVDSNLVDNTLNNRELETSALKEEEIEAALDEAFENFKLNQQSSSIDLKETKESKTTEDYEKELMKTLDESNFDDLFPKE